MDLRWYQVHVIIQCMRKLGEDPEIESNLSKTFSYLLWSILPASLAGPWSPDVYLNIILDVSVKVFFYTIFLLC